MTWLQDMRYAARSLRKSPGFTLVAALTLALGVGANAAIFSVVNTVMLRPLPFAQPDALVRIWESDPEHGRPTFATSHPNFLDWRSEAKGFQSMAATTNAGFTWTSTAEAEVIQGLNVTATFLDTLRITPVLGRNFLAEEDRPGGNTRVVIVSDGFWRRALGSDPKAIGRTLTLNSLPYTVIGVLPPAFQWGNNTDMLAPLAPDPARSRGDHRLAVIGRLADGVSLEQGTSELSAIAARLALQYPESNKGWTVRALSFFDWLIPDTTRRSLLVLLGAVGLVLLIACGNVVNLLLARGAVRQRELSIDLRVVGFAIAIALSTMVIFGLLPAIQAARHDPQDALRADSRGSTSGTGRRRIRAALTIAEVALSVALLIGAGLLIRSFSRLQQVEPGFSKKGLMTARVGLPAAVYKDGKSRGAFHERLLNDLLGRPGIEAAAMASGPPLSGDFTGGDVKLPSQTNEEALSSNWRLAGPGYFATLGIPLRGREFLQQETEGVAIISASLAAKYFPNEDPLGRTIIMRSFGEDPLRIVGVAGDVKTFGLDQDAGFVLYGSAVQLAVWNPMSIVWRSQSASVEQVRAAVRSNDPNVSLSSINSMDSLIDTSLGPRRFNLYLLSAFAGVALALAAIGLFGVMAYLVSQRTREIGVRLALGATRGEVFRLILGRGMTLAGVGAVIGIGGALWLTRVMETLLFSVSRTDPATFITVPLALIAVAALACYLPARRAMRVDPVIALRAD